MVRIPVDLIMETKNLAEILRQSWNDLFRGAVQTRHAFHTPMLASMSGDAPKVRTVVLRKTITTERQLWFYTDVRSPKVEDFRLNSKVSVAFWDARKSVQLRTRGTITIHHQDERSRDVWQTIPPRNRKDYATSSPPGTFIESPEHTFPIPADLTQSNTATYYDNFALLVLTVEAIDYLKLSRTGHIRAQFTWNGKDWDKTFLIP